MTRWQIIRLLLIVAYRVLVKRDYFGLLRDLLPKEEPPTSDAQPVKNHPSAMGFSPELRKMVRGGGPALLVVLLLSGIAMATGLIGVMGYPPTPVYLKGGDGIAITPSGIISATGIPAGGVTSTMFNAYTSAGGGRATNDRADTVQEQVTAQAVGSALGATAVQPEQFDNFSTAQGMKDAAQDAAFANHTSALGSAAYLNVGTTAGTVAAGDDGRLVGALQPGDAETPIAAKSTVNINQSGSGARNAFVQFYTGATAGPDAVIGKYGAGTDLTLRNDTPGGFISFGTQTYQTKPAFYRMEITPGAGTTTTGHNNIVRAPTIGQGGQLFGGWDIAAGPVTEDVGVTARGLVGREINILERHQDNGYQESRTGLWSAALQLVPENEISVGAPAGVEQGFNGNFALYIGHSAVRTNPLAKWHVPIVVDTDATTPTGTSFLLKGGSDAANQPNKTIKVVGNHNDVIDTSGATVAGSVIKVSPSQTFTDGTITKTLSELAASGTGGSGTVSAGTAGQFAYYGLDGTTVSGRTLIAGDVPNIAQSQVTNLSTDLAARAVAPATTNAQYIPYWSADGSKALSQTANFKIDTNGALFRYNSAASGTAGYFQSVSGNGLLGKSATGAGGYFESLSNYAFLALQTGALTANNTTYPAFKVIRSNTLGAYDATSAVALIEDSTAATGPMFQIKKNSTVALQVNSDGAVCIGNTTCTGAGALTVTGNTTSKTFTGTIPAATTYSATTTVDLSLGDSPKVTLTGATTLAFSNPVAGQWHKFRIKQDATGNRAVTWPSTGLVCTWLDTNNLETTTAPAINLAANAVTEIIIHTTSATTADCYKR